MVGLMNLVTIFPVSGALLAALCVGCAGGWQSDDYFVQCGDDGMCLVPAGPFQMGCNVEYDSFCYDHEYPFHEVILSAFLIDRTEVTRGAYATCVDDGGCTAVECGWDLTENPDRPIDCVSWQQAGDYCAWAEKRLPTEAEWEKAARGTDGRRYPWGDDEADCGKVIMWDGHDDRCDFSGPHDVCSRSPQGDSPWGLCDMAGNMAEAVADWYGWGYYSVSPASDPKGPDGGDFRVVRGGAYGDSIYSYRTSSRAVTFPDGAWMGLGFRCARDSR